MEGLLPFALSDEARLREAETRRGVEVLVGRVGPPFDSSARRGARHFVAQGERGPPGFAPLHLAFPARKVRAPLAREEAPDFPTGKERRGPGVECRRADAHLDPSRPGSLRPHARPRRLALPL